MYAKSLFGEDALLNISVEKQEDGKIQGYLFERIDRDCLDFIVFVPKHKVSRCLLAIV